MIVNDRPIKVSNMISLCSKYRDNIFKMVNHES